MVTGKMNAAIMDKPLSIAVQEVNIPTPGDHEAIDIESIITHRYALADIREAVETARTKKDTSIKVMIYPNGQDAK